MKFPKSIHAEGWADHIDAAPDAPSVRTGVPKSAKTRLPLRGAKLPASALRLEPRDVPPVTVGMATATPHIAPGAAALPPQRESQRGWMIAAGVGAAVIAAVAVWSANRPSESPSTPAVIVAGSTAAQADVAAVMPMPEPTAQVEAERGATAVAVAEPVAAEPARLGPPVTTVKPATEAARPVAQAAVASPRPDLVLRADPRTEAPAAQPTPYLQPIPPVAAAPAEPVVETQPLAVTPGTALIALPATAAGPTPETAPLAAVTPSAAASATLSATAPLAQAAPPSPEDSGITQQVRTALAADSTLAAVPIAVSTEQGVVKLEGQAPDAPTRERATVVASSASGVKAVDNRLTLAPATMLSQAPSGL